MAAEWIGLILNVWLMSPAGAVTSLGDDSWNKREIAQQMSFFIAEAERGEFKADEWRRVKQPEWALHVVFWKFHTTAKFTNKDPEVVKRAELLLKASRLYSDKATKYTPRILLPVEVEQLRQRFGGEPRGVKQDGTDCPK